MRNFVTHWKPHFEAETFRTQMKGASCLTAMVGVLRLQRFASTYNIRSLQLGPTIIPVLTALLNKRGTALFF